MKHILRVHSPTLNIQLSENKPDGLTGATEAAGDAHYRLADLGGGRMLAIMVDVTATNEDLQLGAGSWGTLYVGTTADGSLADPVSQPFNGCCADVEAPLSLEYVAGEVQEASQAVLIGADTAWEVHSVSPSGRTVQLLPKRTGVLVGRAVTSGGGGPIAGATVKVAPGGFEIQTAVDGSFRLEVYEGILWKLLVTKDGFIPYTVRNYPNRRFEGDQSEERILVRAGRQTSRTAELFEIPDDTSGTVLLRDHGSFYGALGLTFRNRVLGDFVFETWLDRSAEGDRFRGSVCACKEGQRGLVDIGDQGSKPLEDIPIVPFGYTRDDVDLREGSVYVVRASEGLEGHFVVFRVLSRTEDGIEISYLFR